MKIFYCITAWYDYATVKKTTTEKSSKKKNSTEKKIHENKSYLFSEILTRGIVSQLSNKIKLVLYNLNYEMNQKIILWFFSKKLSFSE